MSCCLLNVTDRRSGPVVRAFAALAGGRDRPKSLKLVVVAFPLALRVKGMMDWLSTCTC